MGFFGDDPFDNLINDFFERRVPQRNVIQGENEQRNIDYIEEDKKIFFVFEIPGYVRKDIKVNVSKNEIQVHAHKTNFSEVKEYLKGKLNKGIDFKKEIPKDIKFKDHTITFNNGVLEVTLIRK